MMTGTDAWHTANPLLHPPKISQLFYHWFDTYPADTPELLEKAYRVRYRVYCEENCFENPHDHPTGLEIDEFDTRSVHTLLVDRENRAVAGTVRLILPDWSDPEGSLPVNTVSGRRQLHSDRCAEISRFAVSKEYRRLSETLAEQCDCHASRRLVMPCITLGLMKGVISMSVEHGITDLYAVMEPSLLRLLSRFAIYFKPMGPLVDYHGLRQPCHVNLETLLERIKMGRPDVWDMVTDEGRILEAAGIRYAHCS